MQTKLHLRVDQNIKHVFFTEECRFDVEIYLLIITIGGSKGGARDAPPPRVQILSFSCSFLQKFEKY